MIGAGYILADWFFCVGALLAAVLQFAVIRSPIICESHALQAMRRMRAVAWLMLFMRASYVLVSSGDWMIPIYSLLPLLILVWADVIAGVARLFADRPHPLLSTKPIPLDA